jgi:hypothetical protein
MVMPRPRIRKETQSYLKSAAEITKGLGLNIKTVLQLKKADCIDNKHAGPIQLNRVLWSK